MPAQDTFDLEEQHRPGSLPVLHAIFPPGQAAEAVLNDFSSVAALFCTTLGTSLLCFFGPPASRQVWLYQHVTVCMSLYQG